MTKWTIVFGFIFLTSYAKADNVVGAKEISAESISQLMREAGETKIATAEAALPQKNTTFVTQKDEEAQPVFKNVSSSKKEVKNSMEGIGKRIVLSLVLILAIFGAGVYGFMKLPNSAKMTQKTKMIQ